MTRGEKGDFFLGGITVIIFFVLGLMVGYKLHASISLW